ncbi:MAG: hypothetical protein MJ175_09445, partial [Clostridia bacterium]|nr:hypothetical protein [Clostridia bacterium]
KAIPHKEYTMNNITVTEDKSPIYEALQSCVSVWNNGGCGAGVIYKMDKREKEPRRGDAR